MCIYIFVLLHFHALHKLKIFSSNLHLRIYVISDTVPVRSHWFIYVQMSISIKKERVLTTLLKESKYCFLCNQAMIKYPLGSVDDTPIAFPVDKYNLTNLSP